MSVPEYIEFEGGDRMPRVGFGTWQTSDEVLEQAVDAALAVGYRHFDTASAYENEAALGRALNQWIGGDPEKRKELFIVTKLAAGGNSKERVQEYFDKSLEDLNLEYLDMYLIHVPFAFEYVPGELHPKNPDGSMKMDHSTNLLELWETVVKLKDSGRVRQVGVSNLNEKQLKRICSIAKPACLQIENHILCQQPALVSAAQKLGVAVVAYSPLGSKALADSKAQSGCKHPDLLQIAEVQRIAQTHGRTPAQVLLRYSLQRGLAVIPKSTNPIRIKENFSVWDFCLSESEMNELAALDLGENGRVCDFSFFIGADKHPEFPFKK